MTLYVNGRLRKPSGTTYKCIIFISVFRRNSEALTSAFVPFQQTIRASGIIVVNTIVYYYYYLFIVLKIW